MSWFIDGKAKGQRDAFTEEMYQRDLFSFYLKAGEKKRLMFLDDAAIGVMEATVKVGYKQFETYVIGSESSVLMQKHKNVNRGYKEYYTVLDLTPYKAKDGKEKSYSVKALKVTKSIAAILEDRRIKAGGSLVGCMFEVGRSDDKQASCGNDWQLLKKIPPEQFPKDVKPIDFKKELKPKSEQFLEGVLKRASGFTDSNQADPFSMATSDAAFPNANDVPFGASPVGADSFPEPSFNVEDSIPF